jgi:hypothetical protein
MLPLRYGGALNLDELPAAATLEMLEACRDRIFALEEKQSARSRSRSPRREDKEQERNNQLPLLLGPNGGYNLLLQEIRVRSSWKPLNLLNSI